ncbi:hypothetical protein [Actinomadura litoris]|uniref:hypothetical protein n=1 Tax=Actinomadura litoris TaxID=2678616 RepID=UPI001FA78B49|nr:hypothetical protein [Actinomadura litoris]
MSWLRFSDTFTRQREWDGVSFEARWHYMALLECCSVGRRWNGRLTISQARRASDVPDPDLCIAELERAGFVSVTRNGARNGAPVDNPAPDPSVTRNSDVTSTVTRDAVAITLTQIDKHIPPPSIRDNAPDSRLRMQRKRAHDKGEHHLCLPKNCPDAPAENGAPVTRGVTRNPGTGLDGSSSSRIKGSNETIGDDQGIGQSGPVGGAGGGPNNRVTRNASVRAASSDTGRKVSRAAQENEAARWLRSEYPGLTDRVIAGTFAVAYTRAKAGGQPVRNLRRYLESWAVGDLADVLNAAMDAEADEDDERSTLRLISSRDRRAAIDACQLCDHNGLTHEDKPRRCDHRKQGHGSQPPILNTVPDQESGSRRQQQPHADGQANQSHPARRRHG